MMTPGTMVQPVEILLVEDNPVDVMITRESFNGARGGNSIWRANWSSGSSELSANGIGRKSWPKPLLY